MAVSAPQRLGGRGRRGRGLWQGRQRHQASGGCWIGRSLPAVKGAADRIKAVHRFLRRRTRRDAERCPPLGAGGAPADLAIAKANVENAKATLTQHEATLDSARIDLGRTYIRSPIDGVVIDKIVEVGPAAEVKIPAGVEDGTHIQLAGEGEVGFGGGPPGDLFLEIVERPHPIFERQGDDLHCTVTLPMTAASLGTKVPLETLDGLEEVDIRPGTQSGQSIPLHARGVTHLRGGGRGDLIVHVEVQTPTKLDPEQERLLRELAKLRGEERPTGQFQPGQQGLFSRLKDAFNGR